MAEQVDDVGIPDLELVEDGVATIVLRLEERRSPLEQFPELFFVSLREREVGGEGGDDFHWVACANGRRQERHRLGFRWLHGRHLLNGHFDGMHEAPEASRTDNGL